MLVSYYESPSLEWSDVAPLVYRLHDYSLDPYMLRWPRLAWLALEQGELAGASSDLDRLDSTIRAISLTHFHLEFLSELGLSVLDIDYDGWLENTVTANDISRVLSQKHEWTESDVEEYCEQVDRAFLAIYPCHKQQIVRALYDYFGSIQGILDSLIETGQSPDDSELSMWQLGSALDFMRGAVEYIDDTRLRKEKDSAWR